MKRVVGALLLCVLVTSGCVSTGAATHPPPAPLISRCDATQAQISAEADQRASPWNIEKHVAKNFPGRQVSWLMKDSAYQTFVVQTNAKNFGRCNDTGCYLFAAPATVIQHAVQESMKDGKHDPAVLGKALGLPAKNFEGTLRMMTLDLDAAGVCVRLPVDSDPGVWKCTSAEDTDCFKFGGYTSGGVPEAMVINAPVAQARVEEVP
ncbi:hypothetical protein [Vitiosangium sp. GDMCC 1.1324]|uniref:hypothetical protein n=1 Tax=Vitiosangium sp. (strain GDMCC 1.1324) TaxID=2138576 RepID=UPI000D3A2380|nr:hypothetical protein [Vitiosangium sp. GDMCC 1.1324]PTL85710.1 hypothetical protein DAT35_03115 [Vitiosangium sp. GDMCC 1.1324]